MESRSEREYLLKLIDDAERIAIGDPLGETIAPAVYSIEDSVKETDAGIASCHLCTACLKRRKYAESILREGSKVLFIVEAPEGDDFFMERSAGIFEAFWKKSLCLPEDGWSLISLIKCPASWDSSFADSCKGYVRDELEKVKPSALVIMGADAARYMTRRKEAMSSLIQQRFIINHMPAYVTYSPAEYIAEPSLKRVIWDNLLYIRDELDEIR